MSAFTDNNVAFDAFARADTSLPIDSLESQVQRLDHQLSVAGARLPAAQAEALWRDRVEVMNSLVQLRHVEAPWSVLWSGGFP